MTTIQPEQGLAPAPAHPDCGTMRGYRRHGRERTTPCDACREASRLRSAQRRAAGRDEVGAMRTKASGRALQRLKDRHLAEYHAIFMLCLAELQEQE